MIISSSVYEILLDLQQQTGYLKDVKETRNNIMITCPFHKGGTENKPSCGVSTKEKTQFIDGRRVTYPPGTVHCFTCGYVATFTQLISHVFGVQDEGQFGKKWLAKNYVSMEIENRRISVDIQRTSKKEAVYVSEAELKKYRYIHPYMYKRGLNDTLIEYFDIGYDRETKTITFPVKDRYGNCLFIQRRSVQTKFFKNEEVPKGSTLFGIDKVYENLEKVKKLFLVESHFDALSVWKYGGYAVSLMGLELLPGHKEILKQLPIRSLVIATDNDKRGQAAKYKIRKELKDYKILYHFNYPCGVKDMNDMTKEQFDNLNIKLF